MMALSTLKNQADDDLINLKTLYNNEKKRNCFFP